MGQQVGGGASTGVSVSGSVACQRGVVARVSRQGVPLGLRGLLLLLGPSHKTFVGLMHLGNRN